MQVEMAEALEKKAYTAFVDEDFEQAVELFTEAISHNPANPDLFVQRAQAHIKLQNYIDAVADANQAIKLNPSLSKAYLRKGIACFSLEEYQTAKAAFLAGAALESKNAVFNKWIQKCDVLLAEEAKDSITNNSPPSTMVADACVGKLSEDETMKDQSVSLLEKGDSTTASAAASASAPSAPVKSQPKFRHDFYEKPNEVVVTIFAKGIKEEDVDIDFGEQFLSVLIKLPNEDPYVLQIRLYAKIVVPQCSYKVFNTKIEIHLAKAENIKWNSLAYEKKKAVPQPHNVSGEAIGTKSYPSSSRIQRDWNKLESEVKKEEKEEKLEGDAALNKLFRDIYQNADEETRRAMNKSFTESSGTVLSTNWKEVGSKHVTGSPPQGMEMKKWEL